MNSECIQMDTILQVKFIDKSLLGEAQHHVLWKHIKKVKKTKNIFPKYTWNHRLLGSTPVLGCPKSKLWFQLERLCTSSLGAGKTQTQQVTGMGKDQCHWPSPVGKCLSWMVGLAFSEKAPTTVTQDKNTVSLTMAKVFSFQFYSV